MSRPRNRLYRFFEILPAFAVWGTFLIAIILAIFEPLAALVVIIVFDTYWVFRVSYFVVYLVISWIRLRRSLAVNWPKKLTVEVQDWRSFWHLVFLPTYEEDYSIIQETFRGLRRTDYPKDRLIVVLAGEERDQTNFEKIAQKIEEEFKDVFAKILITIHPQNLPDEIPGKGSNMAWAGAKVREIIDQQNIPYERVIVSAFDVDTVVHPQYFAGLTYAYATNPRALRTSYQPVALYSNNIWTSPAFMRVAAFGTTFWLLTELAKPERLFTFSSHAMPFQALVDVGFWERDIVTEDSRIFLQCLLHYHGDYRVEPLYIPVSMDTVSGTHWWGSLANLYRQQRRWAWGIEHFPYMLWHFRRDSVMPLGTKIRYLFNVSEGMYSWATAPILIFILGRLPFYFLDHGQNTSVLALNTPHILKILMAAASIGILLSVTLSLLLLPSRPRRTPRFQILVMIFQWLLLPITLIVFGSIPAIEAQSRLALGRYLGFQVTQKQRARHLTDQ